MALLEIQDGQKLLNMKDNLDADPNGWFEGDRWEPERDLFQLALKIGWSLIMPAGNVHDALTMEDTLMTGCQYSPISHHTRLRLHRSIYSDERPSHRT